MGIKIMNQNPFDTPKASHFTADEILKLYVDAGDNNDVISNLLQPKSRTPLRLLGGKGSGKTHLLRYCSVPVRKRMQGNSIISAIKHDGYIGLYVDSGALNAQKFYGKRLDREQWQSIFGYYFEMWLVHHFLSVLRQIIEENSSEVFFNYKIFLQAAYDCFDSDISDKFDDFEGLFEFLTTLRKDIDHRSNNAALRDTFSDLDICFSPGKLIFGLAKAFSEACPEIGDATVCYMIDEAENFSELQQTFFNSLIRYREGFVTFRVGARLYGIHTNDTVNDGEPIKLGSEYEEVHLDNFLRDLDPARYRRFSAELISKRLNLAGISCSKEREANLATEFETVSSENNYSAECLDVLRGVDGSGRERPYFVKFRSILTNSTEIDQNLIDEIILLLKCNEHPLVEKASIMLFYRKSPNEADEAKSLAIQISESAAAFISGDKTNGSDHIKVLDYFKSDLLAQLYRDARKSVSYCGFETLITLSQGIPRNLLMLLKHIYRRSLFAGEDPFDGGRISKQSQTDGIKDAAQWFWEDAKPEEYASSVRFSIEALAKLFRTVRYSPTPGEPALSTFSIQKNKLSDCARKTLQTAENWSFLLHIPHSGSDKNTEERRYKYQLVPMLAPKWDVSYARRGSIELDESLSNALFDEHKREELGTLFKKRTGPMLESSLFKGAQKQEKLL